MRGIACFIGTMSYIIPMSGIPLCLFGVFMAKNRRRLKSLRLFFCEYSF